MKPCTGHTQKYGAVLIVNTIKTAPFVCVCPVFDWLCYFVDTDIMLAQCYIYCPPGRDAVSGRFGGNSFSSVDYLDMETAGFPETTGRQNPETTYRCVLLLVIFNALFIFQIIRV